MKPPRDPIIEMANAFAEAELYEVMGNIYGLINAPFEWSEEVRRRFQDAGAVEHSLDTMTFLFVDSDTSLKAMRVVHVNDMFITWDPSFNIHRIKDKFEFGKWNEASVADGVTVIFTGKELTFRPDGSLQVTQSEFIKGTAAKKIPRSRMIADLSLLPDERTEFRSCAGCGQWVAGSCRPDIAAAVSLSQKSGATIEDLKTLYGIIDYLKKTPDVGLVFRPVDFDNMILICYGDASWANAENLKTQVGQVVVLTTRAALVQETPCSPMDHRSCRTKRVVRSTLAAEACAADGTADSGHYYAAFLEEILFGRRATRGLMPQTPIDVATDCRSLYDAIQKHTGNLEEKRTLIDIASIRESMVNGGIRWVPTEHQWADGLTKDDVKLREKFTAWLRNPVVTLRDPQDPHLRVGFTS